MADSSRDPVSGDYAPVWLIEAVWRRGGVHSIIQADAASRRGLIQVLAVMGRRNRNRPKPSPPQARSQPEAAQKKEPFYKSPWVVAIGSTVAVTFTFLINAPTFFQNLRSLPAEVATTKSEIMSWAKEDAEWSGHWSSFPEGIVDMEDMELSDVDLQITIWSKEGQIDGTVATKEICKVMPLWNYFLLRGEVDGKGADVVVWDVIQGHKRDFAKLRLEREGDVLTVRPVEGAVEWFPEVARIGRHPLPSGEEPSLDQDFCKEQMREFFEKVNSTGDDS